MELIAALGGPYSSSAHYSTVGKQGLPRRSMGPDDVGDTANQIRHD